MDFKKFIEDWKAKRIQAKCKEVIEEADRLFQVTEYESGLWLTYGGDLVAPMVLITPNCSTTECIALVKQLRDKYVVRKNGVMD